MIMICVVVSAMYEPNLFIPKESFIIAADKGFETLQKQGIKPNLVVGDFDSLGYVPQSDELIKSPAEKDDTDTMLALREGLGRGYKKFIIYGGIGGRLDHTFANIQSLSFLKENGASAVLYGEGTAVTLIKDESVSLMNDEKGYISVFSYGDAAKDVSLTGLKYSLDNAPLSDSFPLGVSNEFVGTESEISVKDGRLLLIWQTESEKIIRIL